MTKPLEKISENLLTNGFYLEKKKIKTIFALALPAIIENIMQAFIGVVDMFFIAKISTEAVAALGATNIIMNLYTSLFTALGIGVTALVSRNVGAGDYKKASEFIRQSLNIALLMGIVIGFINLAFAEKIITLLGVSEQVLEYALPYFIIVAVPSVFLCIMMILSSALRGAGDTVTPMKVVLRINIINAVLDYILIFGFLGFSGLGITGAAIATTIARMLGAAMLIKKLLEKNNKTRLELSNWIIDRKLIKSISRIAVPATVERLIMRVGQLVYGALIIKIGTEAYAAHNIAGTIETFSYLPGIGFGVAAATLVGQSLGADNPSNAKKYGFLSYLLAAAFMTLVGIFFYAFAPFLAGLFSNDGEIQNLVVAVLRIIALFQPFLCITLVITAALQGAGDTKFVMYSTFIGIWGVRVVGVYVLGIVFNLGLVGVWLSYALDVTIRGIILMLRFYSEKWKNIKV